ncbi:hypothetical protein SAMN05661096_03469 [Marivirga sericea]|uniref:Lipocalin-like domain-containing protein n=1 Tax=Marivirga sericea TaxID=1028 RepID=A0A1X7L3M3_9BACT|nr:hypothetical protein [Marivirga sericea]SMG48456.1 hypothetical protein SAMN05661096_03469 [Marivirga sericea]
MKNILKYTGFLALMAIIIASCKGKDDPKPDEDTQAAIIEALQGTWTASEVRKDQTVISDFADFSITLSDKNYTTQNGSPVWPESGSYDFETAETEDEFLRQDGRLFTANVNNGSLTVVIIYEEETGRGEYGTYEFVME